MAGALDWLDTLTQTVGDVAGRAVDAAGKVATARIDLEAKRATIADQTPVGGTSPLQTARPGMSISPLWVGVGLVGVVGLVILLRR